MRWNEYKVMTTRAILDRVAMMEGGVQKFVAGLRGPDFMWPEGKIMFTGFLRRFGWVGIDISDFEEFVLSNGALPRGEDPGKLWESFEKLVKWGRGCADALLGVHIGHYLAHVAGALTVLQDIASGERDRSRDDDLFYSLLSALRRASLYMEEYSYKTGHFEKKGAISALKEVYSIMKRIKKREEEEDAE